MLTPCLGREQTQARLATALATSRWVSIVGPARQRKDAAGAPRGRPGREHLGQRARACGAPTRSSRPAWTPSTCRRRPATPPRARCAGPWTASTPSSWSTASTSTRRLLGPTFQQVMSSTTDARLAVTSVTMAGQPAERVVRVGPFIVPRDHEPLVRAGRRPLPAPRSRPPAGTRSTSSRTATTYAACCTPPAGCPCSSSRSPCRSRSSASPTWCPTASLSEAVHALLRAARRRAAALLPAAGADDRRRSRLDVLAEITGVDRERGRAIWPAVSYAAACSS